MSALPPKADTACGDFDIGFGPKADIGFGPACQLSLMPVEMMTKSSFA